MFALNLRRVYCVCDKVFARTLRNRRLDGFGANPGLDKRVQVFRKEGIPIIDDAEEFVEQSESEFYNVDESYNAHLTESLAGKHQQRFKIVKEKYFKENMPNLLTWSEKEQIRHLANTEPDEWTPQKLAESFPVTEAVIQKLLKYPWKPATEERIARHDASAMRNWRELKDGSLEIPEELRQHFLKFSERTIPPLNKKSIKPNISYEKMGEFEQIIKRCADKTDNSNIEENSKEIALHTTTSQEKPVTRDKKRMTLDEMALKIKKRLDSGNDVDIPDQIMLNTIHSNSPEISPPELSKEIELSKQETKEMVEHHEKNEDKRDIMEYPERIRIPKKAYKKGATYKVNDCYYDHDGKFLYRVLGMN